MNEMVFLAVEQI